MIEEIEWTPQAGGYRSLIVWIIYWYYRPISVHFSQRHVGNVPFSQLFSSFLSRYQARLYQPQEYTMHVFLISLYHELIVSKFL